MTSLPEPFLPDKALPDKAPPDPSVTDVDLAMLHRTADDSVTAGSDVSGQPSAPPAIGR